ncbi:3-oxoadipate CoA-transferase beta subunit [Sporosarcina newyorkensis]|uniref:3-oxoadipate CoA-transferase beta subunit n=2 Tax=Sporosarcina newyorkensis TaxID=759851 RepID=A0A1T4XZ23_9BACL|nr:3-oxoadipate CoA-transferase beta subunit [Sporosarcina newyorkensis]
MIATRLTKDQMAKRCASDIPNGAYVNLGIGIPTLVGNHIGEGKEVMFQNENGILGVGPAPTEGEEDLDLVNVSAEPVTLVPGGSYVNHYDSFVMIRGGHIDYSIIGALQVSGNGDLANWLTDPKAIPGVGGAMDLAVGAKNVFVITTHTTKTGESKIKKSCTFPLTASNVVKRIYTDLAVIDVAEEGLVVKEIVPGMSVDDLQKVTEAPLIVNEEPKVLNV